MATGVNVATIGLASRPLLQTVRLRYRNRLLWMDVFLRDHSDS